MSNDDKNKENIQKKPEQHPKVNKTNEYAGFYFSSSLKITDKDSGKIILQMRCD